MRVIETGAREVATLRYSPDGTVLTLLSREPVDVGEYAAVPALTAAFRIELSTGAELRRAAFGPSRVAAISPRGNHAAHVPFEWFEGELVVAITNILSGTAARSGPDDDPVRYALHEPQAPRDLAYFPDGPTLAVAARRIIRINVSNGKRDDRLNYPAAWLCASPDGRYQAAGGSSLRVRVWDRWWDPRDLPFSADRMAASAGGRFAAVRKDGISVGRFEEMEVERELPHLGPPCCALAFSPDGRVLATAHADGRVGFWDPAAGELTRAFEWGIGPLHSLAFAPDGLTCAAGGGEGRVVVWDVDG